MKLFESNAWQWRLIRTIIQGVIGVLIANVDLILGFTKIDPAVKPMIAALVMAVLSPVMAQIGKEEKDD